MERRTSERLVNLTIALLTTQQFISREDLREMVEGYRQLNDESFARQFERDKDTLRGLGVPIETGTADRYFRDDTGYRIRRDDFELPPVEFDDSEVAVLVLAAQVWQQASAADSTAAALAKLWAAGVEPDSERLNALRPHISAREPSWQPIWKALGDRQKVRFRYHDEQRVVQPWMLAWRHGAWYLAGFDELRDAPRLFKLARIQGGVAPVGPKGAVTPPQVGDSPLDGLEGAQPDSAALVDVRIGRAPWLTRRSELVPDAACPAGWQRWRLPYSTGSDVVADLAMAGADARVIEPAGLADDVAAHHAGLVARLGGVS